ncbi:MAG: dephospho-CoA kinase [Verrucomicrobiales bacterium]|nr:dephospho-CoA kinase [Verrucomicrobiales bacterium]
MLRIGVTGGIGMGKSTAARLLRELGVAVVDTDDVAREVVEPGTPGLAAVRSEFGQEVIRADGTLDRAALGVRVFSDAVQRARLEAILHPLIRAEWGRRLDAWATAGVPWAAVVIPLLFETGVEARFDAVVCVACREATQRERLRARGWSDEETQRRVAAQWPLADKVARSRCVIWTEGPVAIHRAQWERALAAVSSRPRAVVSGG